VSEDHDAVGDLGDDRKIVADVEGGGAVIADHLADGGQHLDLRGDVQGGGRLVEDDEIGATGQRHRHHCPLQLPAGRLVRIFGAEPLGLRERQLTVEPGSPAAGFVRPGELVAKHHLADLGVDRLAGVEGGGGTLRHIGDLAPARGIELMGRQAEEVDPVEDHAAAREPAMRADIAQGRKADGRLAGSRLADQAQHLAARQVQRYRLDDLAPLAGRGLGLDDELADGEQWRAHRPPAIR
jgi:hypothetical protein